jgi:hypothetical protein
LHEPVDEVGINVVLTQKLLDGVPFLKIIEQDVDGNPCISKDWRSAQFPGIDFDVVVNHISGRGYRIKASTTPRLFATNDFEQECSNTAFPTAVPPLGVPKRYGTKYVVVGSIRTPNGGDVSIRTVWIIEGEGADAPRFVTAYPA